MLSEGDIVVSASASKKAMTNSMTGAMSTVNGYSGWPKSPSGWVVVPYTISNDYSDYQRMVIESAMKSITSKTCVHFLPRTNEVDYISIENLGGCSSTVGRAGGVQQLSLSVDGCIYYGIVEHELIHSLGFSHEHTRSDRDKYIWINWQNVPEASSYNFQIKDTDTLNTPYDYNSIMHYGRSSFAIQSGLETIVPIPNPLVQIGQRQELSAIDIQRINQLYECGF
ncbi:high choriolytic enzyme 1-like isoform X2 [Carassius auratus]|nr:high choriolytic enzyme 1-like isoform X2 [Carassius auratus]